jgi:uncharacterized repeat protein (TIGR03803 family)
VVARIKPVFNSRLRLAVAVLTCAVLALVSSRPADAQGDFRVLHSFGLPPSFPAGGLVGTPDGAFYGLTGSGGEHGAGTIFRYVPASSALTIVYEFDGTSGSGPRGAMVRGNDGALYGVTGDDGANGVGTIFRYEPGTATLTTLHSFDFDDGWSPQSGLLHVGGVLYGTTAAGGPGGEGTLFRYALAEGEFRILHGFSGPDGEFPVAAPIMAADGRLCGTTLSGGASGRGAIYCYELSTSTLTVLHSFGTTGGDAPYGGLVQSTDGALYGTTSQGSGVQFQNGGTLFRYTPSTGVFSTLVNFTGANGSTPKATLIQGADGALYGTTTWGTGGGKLFKFDRSSSVLTVLRTFDPNGGGISPDSALVESGGMLYGTTRTSGGVPGLGTVFRFHLSSSTFTTLHTFQGSSGAIPVAIIQASDGSFYGTTATGGAHGKGVMFRHDPSGSTTTLHSFDSTHGESAFGIMAQAQDGALYGTTLYGGARGQGTLYRFDPSTSAFAVVHEFHDVISGDHPVGALVAGRDGSLYGVTIAGGAYFRGTLFRYDLSTSSAVIVHSFNDELGRSSPSWVTEGVDGRSTARQVTEEPTAVARSSGTTSLRER